MVDLPADLIAALSTEFDDVAFAENPVSNVTAPQVVVTPGDPFLMPGTMGVVEERWEVLVFVNATQPDRGVAQFRDISLRVAKAAHSVGAVWESTSSPSTDTTGGVEFTVVDNKIRFKYAPP